MLVDGLINHGAERLFCVPGESYLAALDALHDRADKIQVIACRQEGGVAYMAEAHGKITGQPGICFVSRGPGASNAMIGIHTAFQDSTPLLLFIGQISRGDTEREAFQELDYKQVYGGVAKKVMKMNDASRIPEQLGQAWHCAMGGRPGPVVIELPEDMLTDIVTVNDLAPAPVAQPAPTAQAMQSFRQLLTTAKDPLLVVGGAGWTARASQLLQSFSENHQLPVATAFRRTDCFDNTHANYVGELGLAPNPGLVEQVKNSDLIVAIGPRLGDITSTEYSTLEVPDRSGCSEGQKLVHVHISADQVNAVFRADLGIVSQPQAFLQAANEIPFDIQGEIPAGSADRSKAISQRHQDYLDFVTQPRNQEAALRMDKVSQFLRNRLDADAIITVGAGNFSTWAQRYYQYRKPNTFLGSTNGSMGYGVPSAIAAKLAKPDSVVVSFSGDGCYMMNGQELATAVQYHLNVIFLVINNGRYGTIRMHQERHYPGRISATQLQNPDFAALARAYGAFGTTVTETHQFEDAFEQALDAGKPALIELQIDYH